MSLASSALTIGQALLEHGDLLEDIVDVIRSGGSKESIKAAIRQIKVDISDQAMKEELGLSEPPDPFR